MTGRDRLIFTIACMGMLLFGVTLITLGSVATFLGQKFQLDSIATGALFSVLPAGVLAGSLVFGPLADRYGYKIILQVAAFIMFAGFQGIAHVPTIALLWFCVFLFGFGGGVINGATNAAVADISLTNKSANLSLLGVFFGVGALGVPIVIAALASRFSIVVILSCIGTLPAIFGILTQFVIFHKAKQLKGVTSAQVVQLLKDHVLLVIAAFLFFQSGFEGIIANWSTGFFSRDFRVDVALYLLSIYAGSVAGMRLILGSLLRSWMPKSIMIVSMICFCSGSIFLMSEPAFYIPGMILIGAGVAGGFPVMLGLVGNRFPDVSGTAFSIAITIALAGNVVINFAMGVLNSYFDLPLPQMLLALTFFMSVILVILFSKLKSNP